MSDEKLKKMKRKKEDEDSEEETTVKKRRFFKESEKTNIKKKNIQDSPYAPQWSTHELLSEQQNLNLEVARNVIDLLEEGNTIPFIARYRRHVTNNMSPEALREVKETYEEICSLQTKITRVLKALEKEKLLTEPLKRSVASSRSIEELEYVYAPYKPGGKRTLAERAKELGLEEPALTLLNNTCRVYFFNYVRNDKKDLSNVKEVEKGIIHIIAAVISTDTEMLSFLRNLRSRFNFEIKTSKINNDKKATTSKNSNSASNKSVDDTKFDNYNNFETTVKSIKPHQVLAINRGESLKILSVKVVVPDEVLNSFNNFCYKKWINKGDRDETRRRILNDAVLDSYKRLVRPLIIREIRAELKLKAEKASCEVFSTNLKQLLLIPPLKGKPILGIDPGFTNGCKLALVSPMGQLLSSDVIYPNKSKTERDIGILKNMLLQYNCDLIALGNGTACRQTEEWLTNLIKNRTFHPLDVQYTIVNEDGASVYSCSSEAKKEFPRLDPNIISAISLARRVQEPLAELVKIEPQHLGVGMYQHDLKKKQLEEALNDVVSECVSFVGVDLNTASQCLLRHVAGLSDKRATHIIQYRDQNGPFICRKQLLDIHGIGQRIFQQCAGFLRVGPINAVNSVDFYKNSTAIKLDCTYIHPESYMVATKLIKSLGLKLCDVGEQSFINVVKNNVSKLNLSELSEKFETREETLKLILDTLCKPLNHDFRSECSQVPLFKKGLTSIYDIAPATVLTGRIENVTHFGCFVDIGVGRSGLIHCSKYNGLNLQIGNRVEVKVININIERGRIQLEALKKLA